MKILDGQKTYLGAFVVALSAFFGALPQFAELAEPVLKLGLSIITIGFAHKVEKATKK